MHPMLRFGFFFFLFSALLHSETCACTIPVFRYALDRWETDRFQLVLPAITSQNAELTDLLRPLRANGKANLDISTSKDSTLGQAELHDSKSPETILWSAPLDKAALGALLESPSRKQIAERILAGESVVWVIVDDGKAESQPEIERIEKRLKFLEQVAALPIQDPNDPDSQLGPGPALMLKFTTLRLRADDPAEKVLIRMLAGPKGRIDASQSFAAAVFGRGRVLGSWNLAQLDDAALEETSMFLVGRCSCRMKNENPGWDILMNVDWPKALEDAKAKKPVVEVAQSVHMKQPETVVTQAKDESPETDQPSSSDSIPQSPILLTSASLLLAGLAALLYRNKR
jgi:hypothetical protein